MNRISRSLITIPLNFLEPLTESPLELTKDIIFGQSADIFDFEFL